MFRWNPSQAVSGVLDVLVRYIPGGRSRSGQLPRSEHIGGITGNCSVSLETTWGEESRVLNHGPRYEWIPFEHSNPFQFSLVKIKSNTPSDNRSQNGHGFGEINYFVRVPLKVALYGRC